MEQTTKTFTKYYKHVIKDTSFTSLPAKHVYLELLSMQESGNKVFYSYEGLGIETGYSEKTVQRAVKLLRDEGKISTEKRDGKTFLYTVHEWTPVTESWVPRSESPHTPVTESYDKTNDNTNSIILTKERDSSDRIENENIKVDNDISFNSSFPSSENTILGLHVQTWGRACESTSNQTWRAPSKRLPVKKEPEEYIHGF